ncbi:22564_t:CDS:2 [Dentiscutata erythropus]|uniref:22564_t:CDS:1 n=1 Tax=Dentiscutata erythropus TaxID=1348616 RepID=A0A9N9D5A2_9GLOM|nr:22564_t:CDS:2 [Dentiscutata erythropus]
MTPAEVTAALSTTKLLISSSLCLLNIVQIIGNAPLYDKGIYTVAIVVDTLLCLVASFGLFVIFLAKTAYLLRLYSRFIYAYLIIRTLSFLYTIIVLASYKSDYMDSCVQINESRHGADHNETTYFCNIGYFGMLLALILTGVFTIILMIYYAMVINAYSKRREIKEEENESSSEVIETPGSMDRP